MKTITKGKDDLYYLINIKDADGEILTVSDIDALTIDFYTAGSESVSFTKEDVSAEGVLCVDASTLAGLKDGPLKARFHISLPDDKFEDDSYDTVHERLTGYFLKTERN